jgi:hypothetical protein
MIWQLNFSTGRTKNEIVIKFHLLLYCAQATLHPKKKYSLCRICGLKPFEGDANQPAHVSVKERAF